MGLAAAPADAVARHRKPASFDGSCTFSGPVRFSPPMTSTPQPIAQSIDAPGTCTGTFADRFGRSHHYDNAPARDRTESSGDQVSCEFGLASGSGALILPDGRIPWTMHEYRGGATPLIRFDGRVSGTAWMVAHPSQSSDPVAAAQACNGAGLSQIDLDAQVQTASPITG
jgi:hypothetical protein